MFWRIRKKAWRSCAEKVFCIGCNKTGTTSLVAFFRQNGYVVGEQETAELLIEDWAKRDFTNIIAYCESASFFQDVPFSLDDTFKAVDRAFPGSKFILTVRSSGDDWYESLIRHHSRRFASGGGLPTEEDLRKAKYRGKYPGYLLRTQQLIFDYPKVPLYDRDAYIRYYENHNRSVVEYFDSRPEALLVCNLKDEDAFFQLCGFLGLDEKQIKGVPHLNQSRKM